MRVNIYRLTYTYTDGRLMKTVAYPGVDVRDAISRSMESETPLVPHYIDNVEKIASNVQI